MKPFTFHRADAPLRTYTVWATRIDYARTAARIERFGFVLLEVATR